MMLGLSLALGAQGQTAIPGGIFATGGSASRKIIATGTTSDQNWICSKDDGGVGYVAVELASRGISSDSVGLSWEARRRVREFDIFEALIYRASFTKTGTWLSDLTLNATTNPHGYPSGTTLRSITSIRTDTSGAYATDTVGVDADGKFTILIQDRTGLTPAGAQNVVVTDDATSEAISTFAADTGTAGLRQVVLTHPTKRNTTFTVRIARGSGSGRLAIIGVNSIRLTKPDDPDPANETHTYDTWIRSDNYYSNDDGSADYAFRFSGTLNTCGSTHGGETSSSLTATLDGEAFTLGGRGWGTQLVINQTTQIANAAEAPGETIDVTARREFILDGKCKEFFTFTSSTTMRPVYTGMALSYTTFSQVTEPIAIADTTAGVGTGDDVDQYPLGDGKPLPQVTQVSPTTNQQRTLYSSAPYTIPGFNALIVSYNAGQYNKPRFWSRKSPPDLPAGTFRYWQATSLKKTA